MKRITVNLNVLLERLQQMAKDNMHFVELSIVPEEKEQDECHSPVRR